MATDVVLVIMYMYDYISYINSLLNDKILDWLELKGLADDKNMWIKNWNLIWERWKTLWKKEKNAGYQHFLLFPKCF